MGWESASTASRGLPQRARGPRRPRRECRASRRTPVKPAILADDCPATTIPGWGRGGRRGGLGESGLGRGHRLGSRVAPPALCHLRTGRVRERDLTRGVVFAGGPGPAVERGARNAGPAAGDVTPSGPPRQHRSSRAPGMRRSIGHTRLGCQEVSVEETGQTHLNSKNSEPIVFVAMNCVLVSAWGVVSSGNPWLVADEFVG